jgi:quercetin dioxygenase-like cupin family protein
MHNRGMTTAAPYTFLPNVDPSAVVPSSGILSRTIQGDDNTKVIQFTFAPGAELSQHTAAFPASIYIVRGEADLQLGDDTHAVTAGAFAHMPPKLEHAIRAKTELVMLLWMNKGAKV